MMAKRFMDTELWNKVWFRKLEVHWKLLFIWSFNKCDNAGVLADLDIGLASFQIGHQFGDNDVESVFEKFDFVQIDEATWWIPQFVMFQYNELKESCRPHQSVIQKLKERGLYEKYESYFSKSKRKPSRPSKQEQLDNIEKNLKVWVDSFTGVDVKAEFEKMNDWLASSGKLKKDYSAFFRNWLKRAGGNSRTTASQALEYIYSCFSHPKNQVKSTDRELVEFCPDCNQKLEWLEVSK